MECLCLKPLIKCNPLAGKTTPTYHKVVYILVYVLCFVLSSQKVKSKYLACPLVAGCKVAGPQWHQVGHGSKYKHNYKSNNIFISSSSYLIDACSGWVGRMDPSFALWSLLHQFQIASLAQEGSGISWLHFLALHAALCSHDAAQLY